MASATTGEWIFLRLPDDSSSPWRVVVQEFDSPAWTLHEMTFGEWLLAYLEGQGRDAVFPRPRAGQPVLRAAVLNVP